MKTVVTKIKCSGTLMLFAICIFAGATAASAQTEPSQTNAAQRSLGFQMTPEERALRKDLKGNLEVKQMNADATGKRQWLDHYTVWDEDGFKVEEIEYATYGQRERVTYQYDKTTGKIIEELAFNDKDRMVSRRRYEYQEIVENGELYLRKTLQRKYFPDGKLDTRKYFEYSFKKDPSKPETSATADTATVRQTAVQRSLGFMMTPEERRARKGNLVVIEINEDAKGKKRWRDHYSVWDEYGYKVEEIEYDYRGRPTKRIEYQYDLATGKTTKEKEYDMNNRLTRVRKYEYVAFKDIDGQIIYRKKKQINYMPDEKKIYSTKVYEYSIKR